MKKLLFGSMLGCIMFVSCSKEDLNQVKVEFQIQDPYIEEYSQFGNVWLAEISSYQAVYQDIFESGYVNLYVVEQDEGDKLEVYVYPDLENTPIQYRMNTTEWDREWLVGDNYVTCPKKANGDCTIGYGDGPILIKKESL